MVSYTHSEYYSAIVFYRCWIWWAHSSLWEAACVSTACDLLLPGNQYCILTTSLQSYSKETKEKDVETGQPSYPAGPMYQDPNTIQRQAAPSGDLYAQPEKPARHQKQKPAIEMPTYQDPSTIQRQAAPTTGDLYAQPEKPPKQPPGPALCTARWINLKWVRSLSSYHVCISWNPWMNINTLCPHAKFSIALYGHKSWLISLWLCKLFCPTKNTPACNMLSIMCVCCVFVSVGCE